MLRERSSDISCEGGDSLDNKGKLGTDILTEEKELSLAQGNLTI